MKTVTVTIRMTESQINSLDEAAAVSGVSRSAYIVAAAVRAAQQGEHTQNTGANTEPNTSEYSANTKTNTSEHSANTAEQIASILARLDALEKRHKKQSSPSVPSDPRERRIITPSANHNGGSFDEARILEIIETMRIEQTAGGFKPNNKAIADALNAAGLLQSNGNPWNNDRVNTVITRKLPHLK